jgi:phenylalanine-4-hydroxylase
MERILPVQPTAQSTSAANDWTIPQRWSEYTPFEHSTWDLLYSRQVEQLRDLVVPSFMRGLDVLAMAEAGIPNFEILSDRLRRRTGWTVVAVEGLVPDETFFEHLANRRFVAGRFIRSPDQLDYLQEPDIFHDVFGHVPLLADPIYADYMQAYGQGGLRAMGVGQIRRLAHLYWYTVEFGLIRDSSRLKLFGAGIVSSHGESQYALHDPKPLRVGFDVRRVLRTKYEIDAYQQNYFVIDSFEDLLRKTVDIDFGAIYDELATLPDIPVGKVLPTDVLFPPNNATVDAVRT